MDRFENLIPTKKDMTYWIIILIAIIIFLIVWKIKSYEEVINQISLVGSVSSILLALIAISYAFFQTSSSEWESKKMLQLLEKMDEKISELDSLNANMGIIKDDVNEFKQTSVDQFQLISDSLKELPNVISTDKINAYMKENGVSLSEEVEEGIKKLFKKELEDNLKTVKETVTVAESSKIVDLDEKRIVAAIASDYVSGEAISIKNLSEKLGIANDIVIKNINMLKRRGLIEINSSRNENKRVKIRFIVKRELFKYHAYLEERD